MTGKSQDGNRTPVDPHCLSRSLDSLEIVDIPLLSHLRFPSCTPARQKGHSLDLLTAGIKLRAEQLNSTDWHVTVSQAKTVAAT